LGWSEWSEWTTCNADNERTRFRQCVVRNPVSKECVGNEREVRICNPSSSSSSTSTESEASPISSASLKVHWVLVIIIMFGLFCAAIAIFVTKYLMEKRIKALRTIQGSPHFIGSYPNQYSSLPTKDVSDHPSALIEFLHHLLLLLLLQYVDNNKPKRQPSFNSGASHSKITNGNGTLTKNSNMLNQSNTPKVLAKHYDTDTIKRNSALNNMRVHRQVVDDDIDKY